MANMFCGYACIVHAMRGEFHTAAPFIGIAIVLDMLDGRIARMTGTTSAFGLEFDSLADVVSFGVAPAMLSFALGPAAARAGSAGRPGSCSWPRRPCGWRASTSSRAHQDKRYFVGMPSPPAAGVPAATVFAFPSGLQRPVGSGRGAGDGDRAGAADGQHHPLPQLQDARPAVAAQLPGAVAAGARPRGAGGPARDRAARAGLRLPGVGIRRHGLDPPAPARRQPPTRSRDERQRQAPSARRSAHGRQDAATGRRTSTVVPRSALARRWRSCRRSARRCAWRSAGPGRCPRPWSRNRARTRAPAPPASMPAPVSEIATATRCRRRSAASTVSVPARGIACSAFSTMLVSERATSARSTSTGGSVAASAAPRSTAVGQARARRARRCRVSSSGDVAPTRRPRRGRRGEVRELRRDLAQQRDLRQDRLDALLEHRAERLAAVGVHAAQVLGVELNRRQRVLDFVRHLPGHLGPRLEAVRALELAALPLQLGRHLVEVLDQPAQLVGRRRDATRTSKSPRAMRRVARVSRLTGSAMRSAIV